MTSFWNCPGASGRNCGRAADHTRATERWLVFLALLLTALLATAPARAEQIYSLDQRFAQIAFSVSHLGLFSSRGRFDRFDAHLVLDAKHPERTRISVDVNAASVDMPWQDGAAMLRSPDFFDVRHHPEVRFTSTSVEIVAPDRYLVRGHIEIRGVVQPLALNAKLVRDHPEPARDSEVAEFVVTGELRRSAFGMTADKMFISDRVDIIISARIELKGLAHAG